MTNIIQGAIKDREIPIGDLNAAIKKDIETSKKTKSFWYISIIIAVANGFTTGLLGFPDIGAIASVDGISHNIYAFKLSERIFMMVSTSLIMLPFFQQLFQPLVYDKVNLGIDERNKEIRDNSALGAKIEKSKKNGALFYVKLIGYIISSAALSITIFATINYGLALLPFMLFALATTLTLWVLATNITTNRVKLQAGKDALEEKAEETSNESNSIIKNKTIHGFIIRTKAIDSFKRRTKTKALIRSAISELTKIKHQSPSQEQVNDALFSIIYQAQLQRLRKAIKLGNGDIEKMTITHMCSYIKGDISPISNLYKQLQTIDALVEDSPLYKFELEMEKESQDIQKQVLKDVALFRRYIIATGSLIGDTNDDKTEEDRLLNGFLSGFNEIESERLKDNGGKSLHAIKAEIAEERRLYKDNLDREFSIQLMQKRLNNRIDAEVYNHLDKVNNSSNFFAKTGNVLGCLNALVNAAITAAVSSKIVLSILPIIFGISFTNPIAIAAIVGATCIAGFASSYNMTRPSIIRVFAKADRSQAKNKILGPDKNQKTEYFLNIAVAIGALGLGVLSGMQVYSILLVYLPPFALAAALVVGITSFIAVYSLLSDYSRATLEKFQKKAAFLQEYFPEEKEKSSAMDAIYRNEFMLSLVLGIATAMIVWPLIHQIVTAIVIGTCVMLFSGVLLGKTSEDQYNKPDVSRLNLIYQSGLTVTLLHSVCLLISVALGIYSIPMLSGTFIGSILAVAIGSTVAVLYFPSVWNTATSPDINFKTSIIDVKEAINNLSDDNNSTLEKNHMLVVGASSLILFTAVCYITIFMLPGILGYYAAALVATFVTYKFIDSYNNSINQLSKKVPERNSHTNGDNNPPVIINRSTNLPRANSSEFKEGPDTTGGNVTPPRKENKGRNDSPTSVTQTLY